MMSKFQSSNHEKQTTLESRDAIDSSLALDNNNISANLQKNDDNFPSHVPNYQRLRSSHHDEVTGHTTSYSFRDNDPLRRHNSFQRATVDMHKIQKVCSDLALTVTVENTQRTITRSDGATDHEKGSEVFIGKLPRDIFEDELLPVVQRLGTIIEFRIMLDYNGFNRGYAFVTYKTRSEASNALKALNNFEIKKGKLLGVCRSVDNCRLFVGGIPKTKKKHEILEEMEKVTEGVSDVIVYPSAADKSKNRGFAFVEYESHKSAAMARRKLMPGKIQLWNQQIAVDWAEPEVDVDDDIMAQVKILYIRNLMLHTREETLENIFRKITGPATIERVKKIRDYAFVHFNSRENAVIAMKAVHGMDIDGSYVEITWAKPVDREAYAKYNKHSQKQYLGQNSAFRGQQFLPLTADQLSSLTTTSNIYGIPATIPLGTGTAQQVAVGQQPIPVLLNADARAPQVIVAQPSGFQNRQYAAARNMIPHVRTNHHGQFGSHGNYNGFQRNKPRGAGGVRAVGSRQYLNNRGQMMDVPRTSVGNIPYAGLDNTVGITGHVSTSAHHPLPVPLGAQYLISHGDLLHQDGLSNVIAHQPVILAPATISQVAAPGDVANCDGQRADSGEDHVTSAVNTAQQHVVHSIIPSQLGVYSTPRAVDTRQPGNPTHATIQAITTAANAIGTVVSSTGGRTAANQIMYLQPAAFVSPHEHDIYAPTMAGTTAIQQAQAANAYNRGARLPAAAASAVQAAATVGPSYMLFPQNVATTVTQPPVGTGLAGIDSQIL